MSYTKHTITVLVLAVVFAAGIFLLREPRTATNMNQPFFAAIEGLRASQSARVNVAIETEVNLVPLDPSLPDDEPPLYAPVTARGDLSIGYAEGSPLVLRGRWEVSDEYATDVVLGFETVLDPLGQPYLRVSGLPAGEEGLAAGVDVRTLNDKWFTVTPEMFASMIPGVRADDGDAVVVPRRTEAIRESFDRVVTSGTLERYEDARIDGLRQAHYALRPHPKEAAEVLTVLAETAAGRALTPEERSEIHGSALRHQYIVDAFVDLASDRFTVLNVVVLPEEDVEGGSPVSVTVKFNELDAEVDASAPADAVPFETLFFSVLSPDLE